MTTAITTIERADLKDGVNRFARLGAALADLGDRIAAWSAPHYEKGICDELEAMPPNERLDAALGWHARHARMV